MEAYRRAVGSSTISRDGTRARSRRGAGDHKYSRVFIDSIGYELPPVVVTSTKLGKARLRHRISGAAAPEGPARGADGDHRAAMVGTGHSLLGRRHRSGPARDASLPTSGRKKSRAHLCGRLPRAFEPATACRVAAAPGHQFRGGRLTTEQRLPGRAQRIVDIDNSIEAGPGATPGWSCRARRRAR